MIGKSRSILKEIPALMPEKINGNHKNSAKDCGLKYLDIGKKSFVRNDYQILGLKSYFCKKIKNELT